MLQADLERILEENQKQLELAQAKAAAPAEAQESAAATEKMQSLVQARPAGREGGGLEDEVFVLGVGRATQ